MAAIRVGPAISVVEAQSDTLDRSDARLEALGYRPEFRREMNLFAVVGMSFTAIGSTWDIPPFGTAGLSEIIPDDCLVNIVLTGMSSAFQTGLFAGGPLGLFW
ncbi:hypothetical protein FRC12_015098 [Ceratobasidium sp. 428]|nr:hypothetical protein FRC12_015098 [Ceratobasidium sp. 428]